jgi:hypothetical protein
MNAKATLPRVPASPSSTPVPPTQTATSQVRETKSPENLNADQLTVRATKMTVVLKNILKHSCYTHGGLNE